MDQPKIDLSKWRIQKGDDARYRKYQNKIVTRFPPEPSGYLHIGHVKALFINWVIAKRYGGKMIFRYDDTNPNNESTEYEQSIIDDVLSLGITPDRITHSSDYFDILIDYATKLIEKDLAFIDDTDPETMSQQRLTCTPSKCRDNTANQNIHFWMSILKGEKTDAVVRIKFDPKHANAAMRDPSIFRCIDKPHHMTGDKYKVYPTYDFACPIVDYLEGVTHVFRSCEFANRDEQYLGILALLGLPVPNLDSYGKVNFEDTVMSKRKIKALVNDGLLEGWHDPRLLTIRGTRRHGLHHDALIDFIARMGFAKSTVNMTQTALWSINKKIVDKLAVRFTGILTNKLVQVNITGEIPNMKEWPCFKRSPELGNRPVFYSNTLWLDSDVVDQMYDGEEITLMSWGNAIVTKKDDKVNLTTHLEGDFKTTEKKVLWLAVRDDKPLHKISVKKYNGVEDPVIIEEYMTEWGVSLVKKGQYIQLLTRDYCICDNDSISFIAVPDH